MAELQRLKAYKVISPEETIERIQGILKACGLHVRETDTTTPGALFSSMHMRLVDPAARKSLFGCNGKGMTPLYSRASAYGEMIERIQNQAAYMDNLFPRITEPPGWRSANDAIPAYAPDQRVMTLDELIESSESALRGLFRLGPDDPAPKTYLRDVLGCEEFVCVPYYNVDADEVQWIPFRLYYLVVMTNGMCSGNSPREAIIQGLSEVFERFAIQEIFRRELTPPTVPLEIFGDCEIVDRIRQLVSETGYEVIVKDCSLGMGLPVLGVLIHDHAGGRYLLHLGADPSPITALERCMTEVFQGSEPPFWQRLTPDVDLQNRDGGRQYVRDFMAAYSGQDKGQWPHSIFADTPSYAFDGFDHPVTRSDEEDLAYLRSLLTRHGYELLVRDVGFLGQSAYWVYVPGMSECCVALGRDRFEAFVAFTRHVPTLMDIPHATREQLIALSDGFSEARKPFAGEHFPLRSLFGFLPEHPIHKFHNDYIQFLIDLFAERFEKSLAALDRLKSRQGMPLPESFFRLMTLYLKCRIRGWSRDRAKATLVKEFGQAATAQASPLIDQGQQTFAFPSCFHCEGCPTRPQCTYNEKDAVRANMHARHAAAAIDQRRLAEVFSPS
jgi:ribosomal protein S12 methylthiotransferase accessory factor